MTLGVVVVRLDGVGADPEDQIHGLVAERAHLVQGRAHEVQRVDPLVLGQGRERVHQLLRELGDHGRTPWTQEPRRLDTRHPRCS